MESGLAMASGSGVSGWSGSNSVTMEVMSLGTSTKTGPFLPLPASLNALRIVGARSSTLVTRVLALVMGFEIFTISTSWKLSRPSWSRLTFAVMATSGMLSIFAVASPVTMLVAPGPEVVSTTPVLPVERA